MKKSTLVAGVILLSAILAVDPCRGEDVKQWDVFEMEMTAEKKYDNPYLACFSDDGDPLVSVAFWGAEGDSPGKRYTAAGFWDGGQTWRVRFSPPVPGTWSYRSFSEDPGLHGRNGSFTCSGATAEEKETNPVRRGLVRVCKRGNRAGRYFEYTDGTPFLWIGDTWWNWTKRGIHPSTFQRLVDDRVEKGFTVGQLFVPGNGWSRRSSVLDSTYVDLDIAHMRRVDDMVRYANSRGLTMWIHAWWSREKINESIGEPNMRRWWRYLVHRLGAYNVIWVLAGEYNMNKYGSLGLQFWKDLGQMIDDEDPYERIISAHPTPPNWRGGRDAPQWSTADVLHDEPWLDYNQSQIGHERFRNEMVPVIASRDYARVPFKPHVQSECWYERYLGCTGDDVRFAGWTCLLSGAAGHTYGCRAGMTATVRETYRERRETGGAAPDVTFMMDSLDLPGAVSIGHMAKFFGRINWWSLEPHPELVSDYAARYCLAAAGTEYVVYLRWGGSVALDLRPSSPSDEFHFSWYNPREGVDHREGTMPGGGRQSFRAPDGLDWVLHVKKKG